MSVERIENFDYRYDSDLNEESPYWKEFFRGYLPSKDRCKEFFTEDVPKYLPAAYSAASLALLFGI